VLPVAKWQRPRDAELQVLEHEILAKVVIEAVADAGVDKNEISTLAFAQPASLHPAEIFVRPSSRITCGCHARVRFRRFSATACRRPAGIRSCGEHIG